ncbi:allene oxide cyclase barrel-like domain-containing protein [Streptomyces virginiae]|uniref:allene oxide cyclase barrel-like domain-containing protein n=1 Tax=Streptomyces virginiae TaxID=1961 RepID=UPI0034281B61
MLLYSGAAAFVALCTGASLAGATSVIPGSSGTSETLQLKAVVTEQHQVDVGSAGASAGDYFVRSATIYQDGEKIGVSGVQCTAVSVESRPSIGTQCIGTLNLDEGRVAFQSLNFATGGPPKENDAAITGGTGKYSSARGHMEIVRESADHETVTLHFQRG